jgi:hypothetical protein
MEKRFRALRFIGTVYKVFGAICAILTILGAIGICITSFTSGAIFESMLNQYGNMQGIGATSGILMGVFMGFLVILYGGGMAITLYAMGEGVYLLISVEENTRLTALSMRQPITPTNP